MLNHAESVSSLEKYPVESLFKNTHNLLVSRDLC